MARLADQLWANLGARSCGARCNLLHLLVGAARFELATPSPPDWCANQAALRSDPLLPPRYEAWYGAPAACFTTDGRRASPDP